MINTHTLLKSSLNTTLWWSVFIVDRVARWLFLQQETKQSRFQNLCTRWRWSINKMGLCSCYCDSFPFTEHPEGAFCCVCWSFRSLFEPLTERSLGTSAPATSFGTSLSVMAAVREFSSRNETDEWSLLNTSFSLKQGQKKKKKKEKKITIVPRPQCVVNKLVWWHQKARRKHCTALITHHRLLSPAFCMFLSMQKWKSPGL